MSDPDDGRTDRPRYDHLRLGADGERRAGEWYQRSGFQVEHRNWRCPVGELDLVLRRGSLLVFCEVKARSSTRWGSPLEAVDRRRIRRLRAAAGEYLRTVRPAGIDQVRFDVASVLNGRVEVVQDAF
jgi:putative endonuclease